MVLQSFSTAFWVAQSLAMTLIALAAAALMTATGLAFAGVLPWLEVQVSFGGVLIPWAGMAAQISLTILLALLAIYVPSSRRVMMLEASHRDFAVGMDDVARAYHAAHAADRKGWFRLEREFDAVRERFEYLKSHPDLPEMDGELLTIAAQMSEQSRELAQIFSDDKIAKASKSLAQRMLEAGDLKERIQSAHKQLRAIKRQLDDVEAEEITVKSQLSQLRKSVNEIEVRTASDHDKRSILHLRPVGDN